MRILVVYEGKFSVMKIDRIGYSEGLLPDGVEVGGLCAWRGETALFWNGIPEAECNAICKQMLTAGYYDLQRYGEYRVL